MQLNPTNLISRTNHFFLFENAFPDTVNRFNFHNQEIDVFIPLLNIAIEYDGSYYHQNVEKDVRKNYELHGKCHLIRIREDGCPPLPDKSCIIFQRENSTFESLKESIEFIFYFIERLSTSLEQQISLKNVSVDIDRDLGQIYNNMFFLEKENSLADQFPKLTKEWHPTKNGVLKPDLVSKYSNKKVWWLCKEGHEWQASVSNRAKGRKCLRCSRANYTQKIKDGNTLAENNPFVSKEWHPTKNGDLTPYLVTRRSGKKYGGNVNEDMNGKPRFVIETKKIILLVQDALNVIKKLSWVKLSLVQSVICSISL